MPDSYLSYRQTGRSTQIWLERINELYAEVKESPEVCIDEARRILFDAGISVGRRERILLALIDHRDRRATEILEHPALVLHHQRLAFVRKLAMRRRRQKIGESQTTEPIRVAA